MKIFPFRSIFFLSLSSLFATFSISRSLPVSSFASSLNCFASLGDNLQRGRHYCMSDPRVSFFVLSWFLFRTTLPVAPGPNVDDGARISRAKWPSRLFYVAVVLLDLRGQSLQCCTFVSHAVSLLHPSPIT